MAFHTTVLGSIFNLEKTIGADYAVGICAVERQAVFAGGRLSEVKWAVQTVFGALILHDSDVCYVEFLGRSGRGQLYIECSIRKDIIISHPIDIVRQHVELSLPIVDIRQSGLVEIKISSLIDSTIKHKFEVNIVLIVT